jgi:hypothetical protein
MNELPNLKDLIVRELARRTEADAYPWAPERVILDGGPDDTPSWRRSRPSMASASSCAAGSQHECPPIQFLHASSYRQSWTRRCCLGNGQPHKGSPGATAAAVLSSGCARFVTPCPHVRGRAPALGSPLAQAPSVGAVSLRRSPFSNMKDAKIHFDRTPGAHQDTLSATQRNGLYPEARVFLNACSSYPR